MGEDRDERTEHVEKVNAFLDKAGVWYFLTVDAGRPKGRPFGFHVLKDGVLHFGTGTFKRVWGQLTQDPHVEVLALKGGEFMRYDGTVVLDDDETSDALTQAAIQRSPALQKVYNDETGKRLGTFHLADGHAEFLNGAGTVLDEFDL